MKYSLTFWYFFFKIAFFVKSIFYSIQVSLNLFLKVSCSIMVNILLFPINSGQVPVDYCAIIGFSQLSSGQFFLGCDWFWSVLRFSNRVVINFDKINYDLVTKAQNWLLNSSFRFNKNSRICVNDNVTCFSFKIYFPTELYSKIRL